MNSELEELYQEVLLDHSKRPRNFGEIAEGAVHVHGDNPSCGDEIHLHVKFGADGSVDDVKFTGQGCAISQASASMMTESVKGHPTTDASTLAAGFKDLMSGTGSTDGLAGYEDLESLQGVKKFPVRVKCALLPWTALLEIIETWEHALSHPNKG